ncbi:uncharacterized protein C4orf45 homolog isoform X3 [Talpa occidentalis]|uniref:uncharacterized protein C4orf45 homolog isoform X3 n=1 Tax=Talpa occidentalis TaxID=50954 RepID=UPI0023F6E80D|nr:uncharacterized protein C4orf45 homolog isoform X3 [Talpa occidentalis]
MASVSFREPVSPTVGKHMIVTGPDYIKDHLPKVHQHTCYIGEKRPALEKTGDLRYLLRPASNRSLPAKYKHEYVGEIGWGIPMFDFINKTRRESGFHIKYAEPSHYAIGQANHRYQNPWQSKAPLPRASRPPQLPEQLKKEGSRPKGLMATAAGALCGREDTKPLFPVQASWSLIYSVFMVPMKTARCDVEIKRAQSPWWRKGLSTAL